MYVFGVYTRVTLFGKNKYFYKEIRSGGVWRHLKPPEERVCGPAPQRSQSNSLEEKASPRLKIS